MKIAFFWTPAFAANILEWIVCFSQIDCTLVVSQADKKVWRNRYLEKTAVKCMAENHDIVIVQPDKIKKNKDFHDMLRERDLDFIVVVAYGKMIPQDILDIPKYGCINLHGSILPRYRWASPVQAAIKSWDTETWLTTMYMSSAMDEWDILKTVKVPIRATDTPEDIFREFVEHWPQLLYNTLQGVASGNLQGIPQDSEKATYCSQISREDGEVFFTRQSSRDIYNTLRAYTPWPWIYTSYQGKRLILEKCCVVERIDLRTDQWDIEGGLCVGKCIKIAKNRYGIMCLDGSVLELLQVKLEGKKSLDIQSFVNGNREVEGYIFS